MPQATFGEFTATSTGSDTVTLSCILAIPVSLPWGTALSTFEIVLNQKGILMGRLFVWEETPDDTPLSVSPESPVLLTDEVQLGSEKESTDPLRVLAVASRRNVCR